MHVAVVLSHMQRLFQFISSACLTANLLPTMKLGFLFFIFFFRDILKFPLYPQDKIWDGMSGYEATLCYWLLFVLTTTQAAKQVAAIVNMN